MGDGGDGFIACEGGGDDKLNRNSLNMLDPGEGLSLHHKVVSCSTVAKLRPLTDRFDHRVTIDIDHGFAEIRSRCFVPNLVGESCTSAGKALWSIRREC